MAASSCNDCPILLVEESGFLNVSSPLQSSQRIKYTCFDVSLSFIVLGASSGGLYVFNREPCTFIQLLPNKEGPVNQVLVSPDEKLIAFSTLRGVVCVLEINNEGKVELLSRSLEHKGANVTSLVWTPNSGQLFVADDLGRVSVVNLSLFMSKAIFQLAGYMFMQLDSGVVQLSCTGSYLLISTKTRCYICDTTREQYKQIGNKPREGDYGACFMTTRSNCTKILSARPGSRLWEADLEGTVLSTHQFKHALATDPCPVVSIHQDTILKPQVTTTQVQSFNFSRLIVIFNKYLFTFKHDGLYVFDPEKVEIVLWSNHYKNIVDAKSVDGAVYLWTSTGQLHCVFLVPIDKCILKLYTLQKYQLCADLCDLYISKGAQLTATGQLSKLSPLLGLVELEKTQSVQLTSNVLKLLKQLELTLPSIKQVPIFPEAFNESNGPHCSSTTNNGISSDDWEDRTKQLDNLCCHGSMSTDQTNPYCVNCENNFEELVIPQIPFLSVKTLDLQNALLELGCSVSGKLLNGTKSLKHKLVFLEGKFKSFKSTPIVDPVVKSYPESTERPKDDSNELVYSKKRTKKVFPMIDFSQLNKIHNEIVDNSTSGTKKQTLVSFLDWFISIHIEYNKFVMKELNGNPVKVFPFKKLVPHEQMLIIKSIFTYTLSCELFKDCILDLDQAIVEYLVSFHSQHPQLFKNLHSKLVLKNDVIVSSLLLIFSELLEPEHVLQVLQRNGLPCIFKSWCAVIEYFQEKAFTFITTNDNEPVPYDQWPLPLLLNVMYLMFRLDQVESCVQMSLEAHVNLHDISYLLIKLTEHLEFTGLSSSESRVHCNYLFLNYIMKLLDRDGLSTSELMNPEVLYHVETAVFQSCTKCELCDCGCPLKASNTSKQFERIGLLLLNLYLNCTKSIESSMLMCCLDDKTFLPEGELTEERTELAVDSLVHPDLYKYLHHLLPSTLTQAGFQNIFIKICFKIVKLLQVMPRLFVHLIKASDVEITKIIPLMVQIGDVSLLKILVKFRSVEHWELVMSSYLNLSKGICSICKHDNNTRIDLDWNGVAIHILNSLGAHVAVNLVIEYASKIPQGKLSSSFYRSCILSNIIESHGEDRSYVADVVSSYYKSLLRPPLTATSIQNIASLASSSSVASSPEVVHSRDKKQWGIALDINSDVCNRCSLALKLNSMLDQSGLRAFKCGHVYHIVCLSLCKSLFKCPHCPSE